MEIPSWASSYISSEDFESIESAIAKAELKTSGEIVPVVVRRSSTIGHVPIVLALFFVSLFFVLDLFSIQQSFISINSYALVAVNIIILIGLVRLLSPLNFIERVLTPKADQIYQVEQRAINEFYAAGIDGTKDATGILVFVSLMEQQAVVLGDKSIAGKIKDEFWMEAVNELISATKSKKLSEGICKAISMSESVLEEHFPIQSDDTNELKNHLIIKE